MPPQPFTTSVGTSSSTRLTGALGTCRDPELMSYLGVVPSEHSSGTRRRQGSITKSGSQHARRLLIEAAWHYRQPPRISEPLRRRQAGADPAIVALSWKASAGCTTCGQGWSLAGSAERSSRSLRRANSPGSAGRSAPNNPGRHHVGLGGGGHRGQPRARASVRHLWVAGTGR
jgi:hypothetical protein